MRRLRKGSSPRLLADSQRLVMFSQALMQAGSRLEERAWERNLDALVLRLLKNDHQHAIDAALDQLFDSQSDAYDVLMEAIESGSESCVLNADSGERYDALLIAIPILAWTRFAIPTCAIPPDMLSNFTARMLAHLIAEGAKASISPYIYSIDQLPRTAVQTHSLTQKLAHAALSGTPYKASPSTSQTPAFLADARFLLAAVAAPSGMPLFSWQNASPPHDVAARQAEALIRWRAEMSHDLHELLPGCSIELMLANAYAHACRSAERGIRPASLLAADYFLTQTLNVPSSDLHAIIGGFADDDSTGEIDEFRIGFSVGEDKDVVYGVVWPLLGPEPAGLSLSPEPYEKLLPTNMTAPVPLEKPTPLEDILTLLRQCGITRIKHHTDIYAMEFCDDCGAPLYPDRNGDLVHAEMPDDAPSAPEHFH